MARRLRLRITDGSKRVELSADIDSLTHQIVNVSDETLSPNVLIEAGRRWLPLKDYPDAPWLDQLASRAAKAIQAGDVEACDVAASRVLRFAGKRQSEAVSVAHLLVGHLRFVDGRLQEAVSAWQQATRSKTAVRAVAYENMGVAWALSRQPIAAIESLDMAIATDPHLFVAKLSRQNLLRTLLKEGAADLPGRPSWAELYVEAAQQVMSASKAEIDRALSADGRFPTYHVMYIFEPGPYLPAISCQMPCREVTEPAARLLLSKAHAAFLEENYALARRLAGRAAEMSTAAKPAAHTLLAAAEAKIQELQCLRDAHRFVDAATAFFESLRKVDSDPSLPEEFLALLEAVEPNTGDYERLYRDTVAASIYDRLQACKDDNERTWLLTLFSQYADGPVASAHRKAASHRRVRSFKREFWNACADQNIDVATGALKNAESRAGMEFADLRQALENLKCLCDEPATERIPSGASR